MASPEHFDILKQGAEAWNKWREDNEDVSPDLSSLKILANAKLIGFNLTEVDFRGACLADANLDLAIFGNADLTGVNLRGASCMGTSFVGANLADADLSGAKLTMSAFGMVHLGAPGSMKLWRRETVLSGTNFSEAAMVGCAFSGVDLSRAIGLESVHHSGRSSLDIETIYRSKGKIPDSFLRGAGVPEPFIQNIPALVAAMEPIQFYSCFISYSTKDQDFADRLHADLQSKGIRCWFAPEDLKIGEKFRSRIDESIRIFDKLLLILSDNSITSPWVEDEVEAALERERREDRLVLFPIRLDDAIMKTNVAWAAHLRQKRHIGDFRRWKDPEAYKRAFERLRRDLKAPRPPSSSE